MIVIRIQGAWIKTRGWRMPKKIKVHRKGKDETQALLGGHRGNCAHTISKVASLLEILKASGMMMMMMIKHI